MRVKLIVLASMVFLLGAKAADPIWFVSVYGESMQLISGASAKADDVKDGVFLSTDLVGKEIYVRVQDGYELDGFRPYESTSSDDMVSSVMESADSVARIPEPEEQSMIEFGPLSDTGLQYYLNDDYFGWSCSQMYVQPMGDLLYRLRCDDKTPMKHTN